MRAFSDLDAAPAARDVAFSDAPLVLFRKQVERVFDAQHGGFGGAPKFPQPQMLVRLLRDFERVPLPVHLLTKGRAHRAPKIDAFLDFAAKRLRGLPVLRGD